MTDKHHESWQVRSICPHCNKIIERTVSIGERVVIIHCDHCSHGYEYIHVVQHSVVVEDTLNEQY